MLALLIIFSLLHCYFFEIKNPGEQSDQLQGHAINSLVVLRELMEPVQMLDKHQRTQGDFKERGWQDNGILMQRLNTHWRNKQVSFQEQ